MLEKMIRGWRVRQEGPGYVCFFDPSVEHVVLYDGPDLAYEVREGREASEAGASPTDKSCIPPHQLHLAFDSEGGL